MSQDKKALSFRKRKKKSSGSWRELWRKNVMAAQSHTCDHCHTEIMPGDLYIRTVYRTGSDRFFVEKVHMDPVCPIDPFEEERRIHEEYEERTEEKVDIKDAA